MNSWAEHIVIVRRRGIEGRGWRGTQIGRALRSRRSVDERRSTSIALPCRLVYVTELKVGRLAPKVHTPTESKERIYYYYY